MGDYQSSTPYMPGFWDEMNQLLNKYEKWFDGSNWFVSCDDWVYMLAVFSI